RQGTVDECGDDSARRCRLRAHPCRLRGHALHSRGPRPARVRRGAAGDRREHRRRLHLHRARRAARSLQRQRHRAGRRRRRALGSERMAEHHSLQAVMIHNRRRTLMRLRTHASGRRLGTVLCTALSVVVSAQSLTYPVSRKSDHVDVYNGKKVPDPYRWLEDDNSPETAAWVEAQNKVTFPYLESIPYRQQLTARVKQLSNYERYLSPSHRGAYYFFSKNDGLQNQNVLYIQQGFTGTPEVLIDPNRWSKEGTTRLTTCFPSTH